MALLDGLYIVRSTLAQISVRALDSVQRPIHQKV